MVTFNIVLFIITFVALVLSIWSFVTKCENKSAFSNILNQEDCKNSPLAQQGEQAIENCKRKMRTLSDDIGAQEWGQPGNNGLTFSGGAHSGAFGDYNIINGNYENWKELSRVNSKYREREEKEDIEYNK